MMLRSQMRADVLGGGKEVGGLRVMPSLRNWLEEGRAYQHKEKWCSAVESFSRLFLSAVVGIC